MVHAIFPDWGFNVVKQSKEDRRYAGFISDEFANAEGAQSDSMTNMRKMALQYYQGEPRGDEKEGRSQVISLDVAASVNTTLALMRSMLIDEAAISFEAFGPEDEPMAKAEADICQDAFYSENDGKLQLMHAIKDGLLSRQAVIALDVEEMEDGQNRIITRCVPSENIAYQAGYQGDDIQGMRFFAEMVPYTRSDLIQLGVDRNLVKGLPDGGSETFNGARQERNTRSDQFQAPEREEDIIHTWWCYILIDANNDGISERKRVLYCDNTVLMIEDADVVPYAVGSPFITPHRITGESLYDRLKQTQDTNTSLQRQLIDNVATINNGRYIYNPQTTNEDDILNPVAGGGIRSRAPGEVIPMVIPDVTSGILASLEFFRRKRGEIAGAATDMADAEAQLINKSATQASIDKSNSELITVLIADTLANTLMKQLFLLMRHFLRTYATRPYLAQVNGQAIPVDPKTWVPDRRVKVECGKSPAEKSQEAMALQQHLQMSLMAMQAGKEGILADDSTIYRTSLRLLEINGVKDAESYQIDPNSPRAQQARQAMAQQQEQMAQMQAQMLQMQAQIEEFKVKDASQKWKKELEHKYYETNIDAEMDEAKLAGQGAIDLEKERMKLEQAAANKPEGGSDGDRGTLR